MLRTYQAHHATEGAGFHVARAFPTMAFQGVDPFLLLDQMGPSELGPREAKGAPDHPHRGFETVTYMLSGRLQHRDSHGHVGTLGPGDVQWMTAGAGVIHSEMPAPEFFEEGGRMHGVQLWVNLPARDKMMPPRYQDIASASIPEVPVENGVVRIIAGTFGGKEARIDTRTPITYLHVHHDGPGEVSLQRPQDHNGFLHLLEGSGTLHGQRVEAETVTILPDHPVVWHAGPEGADALVITGRPLNEPVARWGPFVMNRRSEVEQAVEDYHAGRFGAIPAQAGGQDPYLPGQK